MCGIAGIITHSGPVETNNILRAMRVAQLHRGPEDSGTKAMQIRKSMVGLAHTRLSILDRSSAGHQPMEDPTEGNWITYNGEIYNFQQLRGELGKGSGEHGSCNEAGRQWRSRTDTEVILKAYARWGRDSLTRLRGMFAFGLWDKSREELFLARDPLGVKPLYYYKDDNIFLFASEVRALLASGLVPRKLSREGVASYLESGSVQGPWTIIDGVRSLMPGHSLVVKFSKSRLEIADRDYAAELFQNRLPRMSTRGEAVEVLREKLEDSVRVHLISDVPVAAFLSGGIDSSAVAGLMSRVANKPPRTFTVVFSEKQFSEQHYAHLVARRFHAEHQDILLTEQDLLKMLPAGLGAMDQPTMDGINVFAISQAVKAAGFSVALSGLGADELFAGYPSFRRARQLERLALLPRAIRNSASVLGRSIANYSVRQKKFWSMVESDCSAYSAYKISRELFDGAEIDALFPDYGYSGSGDMPDTQGKQHSACRDQQSGGFELPSPGSHHDADPTNAVSHYELRGYMANTLLRDTDQMSMAHALEIRVPFIDPVVAALVLGLPGRWKVEGARPKPLLLDALGDMLPEEVSLRPKMGFTLPLAKWMETVLRSEIGEIFRDTESFADLGLNRGFARMVWGRFEKNPSSESWSRPWSLYVLAKWLERNSVTA